MNGFRWAAVWLWAFGAFAAAGPACEHRLFEQSAFVVCRYDAGENDIALALADSKGVPLRSFRRLAQQDAAPVRFAMNAGMFQADGRPLGLYVENSKTLKALNRAQGTGNFYLEPNGVFAIFGDGTVAIETAAAFAGEKRAPRWATQSGPMLVIDGALHPQIAQDGASKYVRNAVGIRDARTALFVISDAPVSFGRLARFFRDGLACPNALYLDGAVSSLWRPEAGRRDNASPLGPMVVVRDKAD